MAVEYSIVRHKTDYGLGDYGEGYIPGFFEAMRGIHGLDWYNAYEGEAESLQAVQHRVRNTVSILKRGIPFEECGPGEIEYFAPIVQLVTLKFLEDLDTGRYSNLGLPLGHIRFLLYMFLKDLRSLDERVLNLAHESEMLIMDDTVLTNFNFVRQGTEVLGNFTLVRSAVDKFPVQLVFDLMGNPTRADFVSGVTPQTNIFH